MISLYAQPYDISADGFFFSTTDEYHRNVQGNLNSLGLPVEEYEIEFINGKSIDAELFEALKINQGNFGKFLTVRPKWDDRQKQKAIIAAVEYGYRLGLESREPDDFEMDIYEANNLRELAAQFAEEGLFGEISDFLHRYLDYDAMARDLAMDYSEIVIAGNSLIYRCC